jgi:hypothetical protein
LSQSCIQVRNSICDYWADAVADRVKVVEVSDYGGTVACGLDLRSSDVSSRAGSLLLFVIEYLDILQVLIANAPGEYRTGGDGALRLSFECLWDRDVQDQDLSGAHGASLSLARWHYSVCYNVILANVPITNCRTL